MLDGDIQIFYYFRIVGDLVNKLVVELVDIEVVKSYPLDTLYF